MGGAERACAVQCACLHSTVGQRLTLGADRGGSLATCRALARSKSYAAGGAVDSQRWSRRTGVL